MDNGADVHAQDGHGFTPLHIASKASNKDICSLLLEKNADPNVKGHRWKTPLHKTKHPNIVKLLLQYGANPYAKMSDKSEPEGLEVHSCFDTFIGRNSDCSRILLDNSITTNGQELYSNDLSIVYNLDLFHHESKRPKANDEDDEWYIDIPISQNRTSGLPGSQIGTPHFSTLQIESEKLKNEK